MNNTNFLSPSVPVNTGSKTFINWVYKSSPVHIRKQITLKTKQSGFIQWLSKAAFLQQKSTLSNYIQQFTNSAVPVIQTVLIFQGTVHKAQHHCVQLLLPTEVPRVFGSAHIKLGHVKSQSLHLQSHGLLIPAMLF